MAASTAQGAWYQTMEPPSSEFSIRSAFPTLTAAAIRRAVAPLSEDDRLETLLHARNCERLYDKLATILIGQDVTSLRTALPGLERVKEERIPFSELPTRVTTVFEREHLERWEDVLGL